MFDARVEQLKRRSGSYWATRIACQLEYAHELSKLAGGAYDPLIDSAVAFLASGCPGDEPITKAAALETEAMLSPLSAEAKRYRIICAGHAHIDMNWMWRYDETVSVCLDTFRTVLDLMREYPDFKFSQSQAAVYHIVADHAPEMLEDIKARVHEGRWEVTASTWVEADKNMPNGESEARHILYTRRYLSELLDIDPDSLTLDFEPDTFGHNANVPEILADGGVRYYYHCRGDQAETLYRWVAPSGRSIIVYREPFWYLGPIDPAMALVAPAYCAQHGMTAMLKVYGVGDHGGGPTRRDLERIIDMNAWPVYPSICFGTFAEYFAEVEKVAGRLPEVRGELNPVFTGCYTSQSRIKKANHIAETALFEAEAFGAWAAQAVKGPYPAAALARGWQNTLFNQFHDIIPGSGTVDTREYALGRFQETMAIAGSQKARAMQAIARQVNTAALAVDDCVALDSVSEGAGVGFGIEDFKVTQTSRGRGATRVFHIFNAAANARREVVEFVVWDWNGDLKRLIVKDQDGRVAPHQVLENGWHNYWGHQFLRLLVGVAVPAGGYSTYTLAETDEIESRPEFPLDPRVDESDELALENEYLRAEFDPASYAIISLTDKTTGEQLVEPGRPGAIFRYITEDDRRGMTAWVVGRYMNVKSLSEGARLVKVVRGGLRQAVTYEIAFGRSSRLTVTVSLDAGSRRLDFNAECDWQEIGKLGQGVPQLNFYVPLAFDCASYRYDMPFGSLVRQPAHMDLPASTWIQGLRGDGRKSSLALLTQGTHGFRGADNALAATLVRSSFDPDPYPEVGIHKIQVALCLADGQDGAMGLAEQASAYSHPLNVISGSIHPGNLAPAGSFMAVEAGSVALSAIKLPEDQPDGRSMIVRLYEIEGQDTTATLRCARPVATARFVDVNEKPLAGSASRPRIAGECISFEVGAGSVVNVELGF